MAMKSTGFHEIHYDAKWAKDQWSYFIIRPNLHKLNCHKIRNFYKSKLSLALNLDQITLDQLLGLREFKYNK